MPEKDDDNTGGPNGQESSARGETKHNATNGNGNGNGKGGRMTVEEIRSAYLKSITGYEFNEENVIMLNEEMSKDIETPEANKSASWPSIR